MRRFGLASLMTVLLVLPVACSAQAVPRVPVCQGPWLSTRVAGSNGAAGTIYWTLAIVNHSKTKCTLAGTPLAQPVRSLSSPTAVGPAATRFSLTGRGGSVSMKPGAVASVVLGVGQSANYPLARCLPQRADAVALTFKHGTTKVRLLVALPNTLVCTKLASTRIAGIALGTRSA